MNNPEDESFFIGSTHEGAEGMFQDIPESERLDPDAIERAKEEARVFPDAQERFEGILGEKGWTLVQDPVEYPTLDEWVEFRITHDRWTKFYPCFVEDEEGETQFVKVQLSDKPEHLEELRHEAIFLADEKSPTDEEIALIEYQPPHEGSLAFICTKAIPLSEGRVVRAGEFSQAHAQDAVEKIKQLEETPIESLAPETQELPSFQPGRSPQEIAIDLAEKVEGQMKEETRQQVLQLAQQAELKDALVHGDACLKNIVCKQDGRTVFVDWATCARGFQGQDAAKLLSNVWGRNEETRDALIESYTRDPNGEIDQERARGILFGMVAENLVHLAWAVKKDIPAAQARIERCQEDESLDPEERDAFIQGQEKFIKEQQDEIQGYTETIEDVFAVLSQ